MSVIGKFAKTPAERKRFTIDYTDWLAVGETISSITFTSEPNTGTPAVVDSSAISSPTVVVFISGGDDGVSYDILCTMHTSLGQVKEDEIAVHCRDI